MCSLHKRESVPLLSLEEVDSLSRKRRECHLCKEERVCSLHRGESVFFSIQRMTYSNSVQRGECVNIVII